MIEFKAVTKTYPDGTTAVDDLSLVVPSEGTTVMVGPSGCGKTTTLRMVNRMIEPTSGDIVWDGSSITAMKKTTLRRQMGYVIQSGGLFPHRSVADNIGTVPSLLGWPDKKSTERAYELMELVGLDRSMAKRFPAQLSGGQQQRVGVARALAADPHLLLMDEPFSAVDPVVRADLQDLVRTLQRQLKKTILMITHDMDEAITMGDRIAVLRPGGVLAQYDTPEEILDHPADDFVRNFVGRDRGYRALTFAETGHLELEQVATVRDAGAAGSRRGGDGPVLVVDGEDKPRGWADPQRSGRLLGLGGVFVVGTSPLREAMEAVLTSPVGLAVAVDESGRYAGVVPGQRVMTVVERRRAQVAQTDAEREEHSGHENAETP